MRTETRTTLALEHAVLYLYSLSWQLLWDHQALSPSTLEAKGLVISLQGETNGAIQRICRSGRSRVRSGLTPYHLCDITSLANISPGAERKGAMCPRARFTAHGSYPESTPSTRLSIKKEPMMMRGMKYSQFQVLPAASFVWKKGGDEKVGKPHPGAWPPGLLRKVQARSLGLVRPLPAPQRLP